MTCKFFPIFFLKMFFFFIIKIYVWGFGVDVHEFKTQAQTSSGKVPEFLCTSVFTPVIWG